MFGPKASDLIKALEKQIRNGSLTQTDAIGPGTFFCATANMGMFGMSYSQTAYDNLREDQKERYKGKKKGDKIGDTKIIAVFNLWDEEKKVEEVPPVKEFYN